jgi:hypothetical protein
MRHKIYQGFFLFCLFALPFRSEAATQGTVTLTGKVPQACDIVVTTEAGATNIADISAGDTDRLIATVNESCNDPQGYTVTVVGTNSGDHTGAFREPGGDEHPFTLKYDGVAVSSAAVTDVNAPGINLDKEVRISYGADATLTPTAGFDYAETLTFTVAAK